MMTDKESQEPSEEQRLLDAAIAAVRQHKPGGQAVDEATARVRAILASPQAVAEVQFNSIDDYIAAIPAYLSGDLSAPQRLLFEEERRRSIPLRRALDAADQTWSVQETVRPVTKRRTPVRWFAAAAAIVVAVVSFVLVDEIAVPDQDGLVQVDHINGELFAVSDGQLLPLAQGAWLSGGQEVRTGQHSSAVLMLDDGSVVEMNERSELSVTRRLSGNRIDVDRGQIIVAASEQGSGTLDVTTHEFVVSVKGTIFEVGHGSMGSRVAVIEGEVEVNHSGANHSLLPGQQMDSRHGAALIDIETGVSWSRDADTYVEMLQEVVALQRELASTMETERRYSTRLLDLVPGDTAVYIAVPNAPEKIADVYDVLKGRMQQGGRLAEAWTELENAGEGQFIDELMGWLRDTGDTLGAETVVTLSIEPGEDEPVAIPMVLSEVDAAVFRRTFEAQIQSLQSAHVHTADDFDVVLISDPDEAKDGQLSIWLHEDLLVGSISAAKIKQMSEIIEGQRNALVGSDFHALLADAYSNGAEFLGGIHLARLLGVMQAGQRELEFAGIDNAQFLIAERHQTAELAALQFDVHFAGARNGAASWLAAPAPMGALDFYSVDTAFVSAVVVKDPEDIVSELKNVIRNTRGGTSEHDGSASLFENDLADDMRNGLLSALGGEAAFGLDGPAFPVPAWKAVLAVYNADLVQSAIERIVSLANERLVAEAVDAELLLTASSTRGYLSAGLQLVAAPGSELAALQDQLSFHYAFVDGYLVVAPNEAMVGKAIDQYHSGVNVLANEDLRRLLPNDGHLDFSAMAFSRLGEFAADLVTRLPTSVTAEQQQVLTDLSNATGASLYSAYGETDRLRFVQNGNSALPFGIGQLLSLGTLINSDEVQNMLQQDPN
jgi:hypothetical protein